MKKNKYESSVELTNDVLMYQQIRRSNVNPCEITEIVTRIHRRIARLVNYYRGKFSYLISIQEFASAENFAFFNAIERFDETRGKFTTFYSNLLTNEIFLVYRQNKKRNKDISLSITENDDELLLTDLLPNMTNHVEEYFVSKEYYQFILMCISLLDDDERTVLCGVIYGKTQAEIAKCINVSQRYVSTMISQIRSYFMECRNNYICDKFDLDSISNEEIFFLRIMQFLNIYKVKSFEDAKKNILKFKRGFNNEFSYNQIALIKNAMQRNEAISNDEMKLLRKKARTLICI